MWFAGHAAAPLYKASLRRSACGGAHAEGSSLTLFHASAPDGMLERVRARSMLRRLDLRHVAGNPLEADKPAFWTLLFTHANSNKPDGLAARLPPSCCSLTS